VRDLALGVHPKTRIFHPQYLVNESLKSTVEDKFFGDMNLKRDARILDVGCGSKPYSYLANDRIWFGIDIYQGPNVDLIIDGISSWHLEDGAFDAILCTEVLEHAVDPALVVGEMLRVLKPNGIALITTPFLYGVHGAPYDFRRYTSFGLIKIVDKFEVLKFGMLGGIGSSLAINFNNWIIATLTKNIWLNLVLTPFSWLVFAFVNLGAKIFDFIDKTNTFGTNCWIIIRKSS